MRFGGRSGALSPSLADGTLGAEPVPRRETGSRLDRRIQAVQVVARIAAIAEHPFLEVDALADRARGLPVGGRRLRPRRAGGRHVGDVFGDLARCFVRLRCDDHGIVGDDALRRWAHTVFSRNLQLHAVIVSELGLLLHGEAALRLWRRR